MSSTDLQSNLFSSYVMKIKSSFEMRKISNSSHRVGDSNPSSPVPEADAIPLLGVNLLNTYICMSMNSCFIFYAKSGLNLLNTAYLGI
jgi:hypothetical protein